MVAHTHELIWERVWRLQATRASASRTIAFVRGTFIGVLRERLRALQRHLSDLGAVSLIQRASREHRLRARCAPRDRRNGVKDDATGLHTSATGDNGHRRS